MSETPLNANNNSRVQQGQPNEQPGKQKKLPEIRPEFNVYEWARKKHVLIYFGLAVALVHTASFFYKIEDVSERWLMLPSAILIECFLAFLSYYSIKKSTPLGAASSFYRIRLSFLGGIGLFAEYLLLQGR